MARRSYAGAAAALALSTGINATDLSIVTTGTATGWPTGSGGKFLLVIDRGTASEEKLYATSRSANTFTIASTGDRGVDGTSASSHAAGAVVEHCVGAVDLDEPNDHIFDTTNDDHTQYLDTTRHDVTARHTFGAAFTAATPVQTGTANASGSAATVPRGDHVHLAYNHVLGRASATANQNLSGSQADVTSITATVTVPSGSRVVKITVGLAINNISAQTVVQGYIMEGATQLQTASFVNTDAASAFSGLLMIVWVGTPTAAAHTYKAQAKYAGSGPAALNGATAPSFILVEDIGT